jgi:hypothetical protein
MDFFSYRHLDLDVICEEEIGGEYGVRDIERRVLVGLGGSR